MHTKDHGNQLYSTITILLYSLMRPGGVPTTLALQRILVSAVEPRACRIGHPRGELRSASVCWPPWPMSDRGSSGAISDGQLLRRDCEHVAQLHRHTAGLGTADGRGE